jgi:hypothetical protein
MSSAYVFKSLISRADFVLVDKDSSKDAKDSLEYFPVSKPYL